MSLLVIVPSRGRPENVLALWESWRATTVEAHLLVCVDNDDERLGDYTQLPDEIDIRCGPRLRMGPTLNAAALEQIHNYDHVGFMGDDHRPEVPAWDTLIVAALDRLGTGIVYGDDGIQGEALPTAVFMTMDIVRALGYMCLPGAKHLFLDDGWLALGRAADCINYLPHVKIGHHHPLVGLADWDAGYAECNSRETWDHDEAIFKAWQANDLPTAAAKIRALRGR